MSELTLTIDDAHVRRVFALAPVRATRRIGELVEGGAIDVQREMRLEAPVHDGQYRSSIRYTFSPTALRADIRPHVDYAQPVESGSRPHWVSVRPGTSLRKWADDHGISPFALQASIAKKGTRANPVVARTFEKTKAGVERDIERGVAQLAQEIDRGL